MCKISAAAAMMMMMTVIVMVCFSAWLGDHYDPLIARVSRRAAGLSNLTLDSAEEMQVFS